MLRLLAWLVVAVLLGAAVFELALALGAGSLGRAPGGDVPGAGAVLAIGAVAMLVGAGVAAGLTRRPSRVAALLAPSAAAFMVAHFFTYDAYYAPSLRRYSDDGAVPLAWVVFVAIAAAGAGALAYFQPRAGAVVTCIVLLLILLTTAFTGGH
jgi:uncharacterized membrane protein YbaN (DUF454 family)